MLIKAMTEIYIEVKDEDEAEAACSALTNGLDGVIRNSGFPHGEIVDADVDHYEKVSDEEAEEKGLVE